MQVRLKFRVSEIVIGILLTVAIFAMGMVFQSSRREPSSAQPKHETQQIEDSGRPEPFTMVWLTHDGTVFFTFVLSFTAAIQAGLFLWQLRYMSRGMDDAKLVAKATDRNARAAIALQSPLIRIEPDTLGNGDGIVDGVPYENCSVGTVAISNFGSTKAFPTEILYGWTVGDTLPPKPKYQFLDRFPLHSILEPGAKAPTRKILIHHCILAPGEWAKICRGNWLWFYCDLLYDDFMDEPRRRAFCWRWSNTGYGLAWRPERDDAYNRKT